MTRDRIVLLTILCCGTALRIATWPGLHEVRDPDELTYSWGSLQLLEGNLPGIHYAPAGPQTWIGWCYGAISSAAHFVFPDKQEREAPLQIRPFLAVEHTLFDTYRDSGRLRQLWIIVSFLFALAGIAAAFGIGKKFAGDAGGIFVAGTVAFLPLFVEFSVQARPYVVGWSLGIIGLYYSMASAHPRRWVLSAVFMGLAVASRVEMLMLAPIACSHLRANSTGNNKLEKLLIYGGIMLLSFVAVAPWYVATLIGALRAIATIRGSTTGLSAVSIDSVIRELLLTQGMLLQVLLFFIAIGVWLGARPRRPWLAIYCTAIFVSLFKGGAFGLRYQGAPLIVVIVGAAYALAVLQRTFPRVAMSLSLIALVLPVAESSSLLVGTRRAAGEDSATAWIEQHIPAGTIVYVRPWITNLLPTDTASNREWSEVAAAGAYERKFRSGMERFGIGALETPRALADVNLALERANRRFLFILGARQWIDAPRYDLRIFELGPAFGVRDVVAAFRGTGGVVVLRGRAEDPIAVSLGRPTMAWLNKDGSGTRIFCSALPSNN